MRFISNIAEFFASNYFNGDFADSVFQKSGYSGEDRKTFHSQILKLKQPYFKFKRTLIEKRKTIRHEVNLTHEFNTKLLKALGYDATQMDYNQPLQIRENEVVPVRHILRRAEKVHLMVLEMHHMVKVGESEPDGLFEQSYASEQPSSPPQKYHRSQWQDIFTIPAELKLSPTIINKVVDELCIQVGNDRPQYILLLAGNIVYLIDTEKWYRGAYLIFDLEQLFDAAALKNSKALALFYLLLSKDTLAPITDLVLMDKLKEESLKNTNAVAADLKEGVIYAVETLANEAVWYMQDQGIAHDTDAQFASDLKDDCLMMVYRLLFIFYAESRENLDILPHGSVYKQGYSLEMLRDLEQVQLISDSTKNGYFFDESLKQLFSLLSSGHKEARSKKGALDKSFQVRKLDSPFFDDARLKVLNGIKYRNEKWQEIIRVLSLSKVAKGKSRGRISYANLGINQLGSVYESLLAFRGYFADTDLLEVHRKLKAKETSTKVAKKDGSYLVPRSRRADFDEKEIYKVNDADKIIPQGTFIYRLSGRDRQKSASYYTPEVLTQCTVKYTLKGILERIDKEEIKADELLKLKILEPAMGAAAFQNEVINQLAEAYLKYKQQETRQKKIAPDKYQTELQKVKAFIALNNVYGVDLNPTAVELGKLSLWLNVIHKDMETPFFGYRLGTGNAVVGAWLKVYKEKDLILDPKKKRQTKEWWNIAPDHLKFGQRKFIKRDKDQIYHFLLPDKGMASSGGIKLLKDEYDAEARSITNWRREFIKPLGRDEINLLNKICTVLDHLLEEHYYFQVKMAGETATMSAANIWPYGKQGELATKSYNEREALAKNRLNSSAPYFKLKMVMDYWCSLWFWDMREAKELPSRAEWYEDLSNILELDETLAQIKANKASAASSDFKESDRQSELFVTSTQLSLGEEAEPSKVQEAIIKYADSRRRSLFQSNRLQLVQAYGKQYRFFHYQLEFLEVFKGRGGFDIAVGNPPWLKLQFEEKGIMGEDFPELLIRKVSAPKVRELQSAYLEDSEHKELYLRENIEAECSGEYMNAIQNYPLLKGQQTNLYKCILENGFEWISSKGFLGLLHPEGVYDYPKGKVLRREMYLKLVYHFQFKNELSLFKEIDHQNLFSINIYGDTNESVSFDNINNLFHPSTIDGCYNFKGNNTVQGYKIKSRDTGKMVWNTKPHIDRISKIDNKSIQVIAKVLGDEIDSTRLLSIHCATLLPIFGKLSSQDYRMDSVDYFSSEAIHETEGQKKEQIIRKTDYYNISDYKYIISGPNFFVANPLYKTPRVLSILNSDYDVINLIDISDTYFWRTNYTPVEVSVEYLNLVGNELKANRWIDTYRLAFRRRIGSGSERSLTTAIIPPKISHVNTVFSIQYNNYNDLLKTASITSSLPLDFFIKATGKSDVRNELVKNIPLLTINYEYLSARVLLLNCLNKHYSTLWESNWDEIFLNDGWSKRDDRLKLFSLLSNKWNSSTPLRNYYERRQALIEIDVITSISIGLTLDELILIYNIQFPVLQQNEDDTWYDRKGNIVFTCSKGLVGVGLSRPEWNLIKEMSAEDKIDCSRQEHMRCEQPGELIYTITKSELYQGEEVTYYAPFDKCDRVEDYKVAWAHFEKLFAEKEVEEV